MRQIVLIHVIVLTIFIFCQSLILRSKIAKDLNKDPINDHLCWHMDKRESNLFGVMSQQELCIRLSSILTYLRAIF